jgi:hypothetical protein
MNLRSILSAAGVLGAAFGAQALTITSLTPQGEVAQVRQVVAKFDASAVNFGDPKAPAPFSLSLQRRPGHRRQWPLDQRPGVGLPVRPGPAARRALHAAAARRLQVAQGRAPECRGHLHIQYRRALCATHPSGHLPAHRGRAALPAATQRRGHAAERDGQRLVRAGRLGRARAGAPHRRRGAHRAAGVAGAGEGGGQRPVALRCTRMRPALHAGLEGATGLWKGRGHTRRRAQFGGKALYLHGARAVQR